jgi:hypothetical protein
MCACAPALRPVLGRLFGLQQHHRDGIMYTDHDGFGSKEGDRRKAEKSKRNEISTHSTVILYDLEGIGAEDGLGYTVSISAANRNGRRHHHRGSHGFGFSGRRSSSRQQSHPLSSRSGGTAARSTSQLQKQAGVLSSHMSSSPRAQLSSVDSGPPLEEPLEIVTRHTVEVRESFLDLDAAGAGAAQAESSEQTGFAGALWRSRNAFGAGGGPGGRASGGSGGSGSAGGDERDALGARRSSGGRRASAPVASPPPSAAAFYDDGDGGEIRVVSRAEERAERGHAGHHQPQQQGRAQQHLRTPSYPPASRRSTVTRGAGAASPFGSSQTWAAAGGRMSSAGSHRPSGGSYYASGGGSAGSRSSSAAGGELHGGASAAEAAAEDMTWMLEIATMREILRWQRREGSMYAEDGSLMSGSEHDRQRT